MRPDDEPRMDFRTRAGRRSTREVKGRDGASPSIFESLMGYVTDRMARSAMSRVKRGAREVVRWTALRLVLAGIGAAILAAGILFTLGAGLKGLEALHWPSWLAYLTTGVFAILIALAGLRGLLWPKNEQDAD